MANDPEIPTKSIVDYVFRWDGQEVLSTEQQQELGILSAGRPGQASMPRDAAERKANQRATSNCCAGF